MQFEEKYTYPANLAAVWEMYSATAFTEQRALKARMISPSATVNAAGETLELSASGQIDPEMIPAQAKQFIRGDVTVHMVEKWQKVSATEARGTMEVTVKGAPVTLSANCILREVAADETERQMDGSFTVSVPLVGARLEKKAARFIPMVINADKEAGIAWLEGAGN